MRPLRFNDFKWPAVLFTLLLFLLLNTPNTPERRNCLGVIYFSLYLALLGKSREEEVEAIVSPPPRRTMKLPS